MSIKHPPLPPDSAPFDDPDNPEWTEAMFAEARANVESLPPVVRALLKRGRPKLTNVKVAVKLRLDPDVVDGFKAEGPGWQTRINATLREALDRQRR